MSTFEGKLLEDSLDFIRIDQFESENHDGTAFFLSHFHSDHRKGLFEELFLQILTRNKDKMLYCSAVTKNLVLRHYSCRIPEYKICAMGVNESVLLNHEGRNVVEVTTLPAGHCPGSVMFLIEQGTTRVLYTGDFRINPNDLCKFKALHYKDGSLKEINRLYLDTTFCDPKWLTFPSRKETVEDTVEIAREWLEGSASHRIGILYNSYCGLEFILMEVSKALKTKISVIDDESYLNYSCIPELHPALCRRDVDSKVHLCSTKSFNQGSNCQVCWNGGSDIKIIKPCAYTFTSEQLEFGRHKNYGRLVRIAYSYHCSLEELIGTVKYLEPVAIHPCVLRENTSERQVLENLRLDVEVLKRELKEKKENTEYRCSSSSPPAKRFCLSPTPEREPTVMDGKSSFIVSLSSGDEGENKPLSQNSIDSPPL